MSIAARPALGLALMAAASLLVPVVDGISKHLTGDHSPFLVAWARYASSAGVVLLLVCARPFDPRQLRIGLASNLLRTVFIVAAMTYFLFAIVEIPIATGLGGFFLGPLVATVLAVAILRERMTGSRLVACGLGLVGALAIIRPGLEVETGSLLAVASGVFFGGYLIATRAAALSASPLATLAFQVGVGVVLLTPFAVASWSWFSPRDLAFVVAMGLISTLCHFLVIAAFRHADASILSPLAYLELVSALLIGHFVFSEVPQWSDAIGIAAIAMSGLLVSLAVRRREASP